MANWEVLGVTGGAVLGLILGAFAGYELVAETARDVVKRDELKRECIAGNDRACQIYEVDYGRE